MGLFLTRRSTTGLDLEASNKPNVCLLLIAFYLWHICVEVKGQVTRFLGRCLSMSNHLTSPCCHLFEYLTVPKCSRHNSTALGLC